MADPTAGNPMVTMPSGHGALGDLIQNYQIRKAQDTQLNASIDGMINAYGPAGISKLSPDSQKLAEKFLAKTATLKDKMQLAGAVQAEMGIKQQQQQQAKTASDTALNNSQAGLYAAQAQTANNRNAYIQQLMQGGGGPPAGNTIGSLSSLGGFQPDPQMVAQMAPPAGGTGTAPPAQKPQTLQGPPPAITLDDPRVKKAYPQYMQMALGDPEKATSLMQQGVDAVNKKQSDAYTALTQKVTPTGNYYFKGLDYKDGAPQTDIYAPEIMTGQGTQSQSLSMGPQEVRLPHGQLPGGPVVKLGNGTPDNTAGAAAYNTNDPAWQASVKDAYDKASSSSTALANADMLRRAAIAYTSGNTGNFNAIIGNPAFSSIFSVFKGSNPAAAFKTALAGNTQSVLDNIRGPNGSVGGRILQNEYENTQAVLPEMTADNQTILAAANNNYSLADRRNNIDQAYAKFRETMPDGQARSMAVKLHGAPPALATGFGANQTATNPQDPNAMVQILDAKGNQGSIPQSQLPMALKRGAKLVNPPPAPAQ